MALASNAFFTVAELKGFFPALTESDATLEFYINALSQEIESFTMDKFAQRDETLVLDGPGKLILDLGSHAVKVTEVKEGDSGKASTGVIRDPLVYPYVLRSEYGHLFSLTAWPIGVQNIQVKARVGWGPDNSIDPRAGIPADLKMVFLRLFKSVQGSAFSSAFSLPIQSESIGSYSYSLATMGITMTDIIGSDHSTLLRYRRWALA